MKLLQTRHWFSVWPRMGQTCPVTGVSVRHSHPTASIICMCTLPHPLPTQQKCLSTLCRQVLGKCNPWTFGQRVHSQLATAIWLLCKVGPRATKKRWSGKTRKHLNWNKGLYSKPKQGPCPLRHKRCKKNSKTTGIKPTWITVASSFYSQRKSSSPSFNFFEKFLTLQN